eukprot:PhM_4_TR8407/c2_g1_i1/m.59114
MPRGARLQAMNAVNATRRGAQQKYVDLSPVDLLPTSMKRATDVAPRRAAFVQDQGFFSQIQACIAETETPYSRMLRVCRWQKIMSVVQIIFGSVLFVFAGLQEDSDNTFQNIFSGLISVLNGVIGFVAGWKHAEFLARVFFVVQMWLVSNLTLYLFMSIDEGSRKGAACNPSAGSFTTNSNSCGGSQSTLDAKIALATLSIFFCVVSAVISKDMDDAVNDYAALKSAEAMDQDFSGFGVFEIHERPDLLTVAEARSWHLQFGNNTKDVLLEQKDFTPKHHKKGQTRLVFKKDVEKEEAERNGDVIEEGEQEQVEKNVRVGRPVKKE